jgi:predicted nuclease of predicted toxin-antitoxin system
VAPRFLIDENLSPRIAQELRMKHGYDALHVNEVGLQGAADGAVLSYAVAENRVLITNNGNDFRKLARRAPNHPGLGVIRDAGGRALQIKFAIDLPTAIEAYPDSARNRLFEIDGKGVVRGYALP